MNVSSRSDRIGSTTTIVTHRRRAWPAALWLAVTLWLLLGNLALAQPPRNREELRTRLQELRETYAPYLRSLPAPLADARIEWKVQSGGTTYANGLVPADVPAADAVRVGKADLSGVPDTADVVTISLALLDADGNRLAQYEQQVFLRLWRDKEQLWTKTTDRQGAMKLSREVDTSIYPASFASLGHLEGEGDDDDLLLSQMGPQTTPARLTANDPLDIGGRRELFVDEHVIDRLDGARLKLHPPQPREIVLKFDQPWEGLYSGYETILKIGDTFRLYYRGMPIAKHTLDTEVTCIAESRDGVRWTKPKLGLFEVQGTKENNVVLARHRACHNFAPFIDVNPDAPANQKFKALGGTGAPGLIAFVSHDGIHWKELQREPVITQGAFDSQNNAFWSESEGRYVCYFRVFREGKRWIARTTSKDFIRWTEPVDLDTDGKPREHLYTNQMAPYVRAPHIYLGLPTRFFPGRRVVTEQEAREIATPTEWDYANDCTDVLLCSARGGAELRRTFLEAFVRPGRDLRNWTSRANYAARGIVETADGELSLYVKHNAGYPTAHVRRYTLRPDGFVSVHGPYSGGQMITKPLVFSGNRLTINYATSAAGGLQVELQAPGGEPIDGFALTDCPEIIGDRIEHTVRWKTGEDVGQLAGKQTRLRVVLHDADLYSIQFSQ